MRLCARCIACSFLICSVDKASRVESISAFLGDCSAPRGDCDVPRAAALLPSALVFSSLFLEPPPPPSLKLMRPAFILACPTEALEDAAVAPTAPSCRSSSRPRISPSTTGPAPSGAAPLAEPLGDASTTGSALGSNEPAHCCCSELLFSSDAAALSTSAFPVPSASSCCPSLEEELTTSGKAVGSYSDVIDFIQFVMSSNSCSSALFGGGAGATGASVLTGASPKQADSRRFTSRRSFSWRLRSAAASALFSFSSTLSL
mmetsp:Transcript_17267/g.42870  ORF Transcript_17267/g.42870 Transcript_17267/m.42870 type:complete len:260 (+) Transcript_17267:5996-6775(+)